MSTYRRDARNAVKKEDWKEAVALYQLLGQEDSTDLESVFYLPYLRLRQALAIDNNPGQRKQAINELVQAFKQIESRFSRRVFTHNEDLLILFTDSMSSLMGSSFRYTSNSRDGREVSNDMADTYQLFYLAASGFEDSLMQILFFQNPRLFYQCVLRVYQSGHEAVVLNQVEESRFYRHLETLREEMEEHFGKEASSADYFSQSQTGKEQEREQARQKEEKRRQLFLERERLEKRIEYLQQARIKNRRTIQASRQDTYEYMKISDISEEIDLLNKRLRALRWYQREERKEIEERIAGLEKGREMLQRVLEEQLNASMSRIDHEIEEVKARIRQISKKLSQKY